jgi:hypothetical protein
MLHSHLSRRQIAAVAAILPILGMAGASSVGATASGPVTLQPSWSFSTGATTAHSPYWGPQPYAGAAVGDLFGNGQREVVAAFPNGSVYVFNSNGQVMPGWPKNVGDAVDTTPTLADLDGNGRLEVLVTSQNGYVYAWNGDGSSVPGWPVFAGYGYQESGGAFNPGFLGGVAVGDLFGNGEEDVVASSLDHFLYAWNAGGQLLPGFPVALWDTAVQTPTLADLDNNGQLWIIAGGDSLPNEGGTAAWYAIPPTGCPTPNATLSGCEHANVWPVDQNEVTWSSAAAGNLTGNGSPEIVTGTGHFYSQTLGPANRGAYLHILTAPGGTLDTLSTSGDDFGSPALGSLSANGTLDIAEQDENSVVYVWGPSGNLLWSASAPTSAPVTNLGSPAIAPISGGADGVWTPGNSYIYGWSASGGIVDQANINAEGGIGVAFATPTIADLGTGQLFMIDTYEVGSAYAISTFAIPGTSTTSIPINSWPTFHGNNQHSGGVVPIATVPTVNGGSPVTHTNFTLSWGTEGNVAATGYDVWVYQASLGWDLFTTTSATSTTFIGLPGDTYSFFIDAHNQLGSADLTKVQGATTTIPSGATSSAALPFGAMYSLSAYGQLGPVSSPLISGGPMWPEWQIAKAVAVDPYNPTYGQIMDGFGGLHQVGGAPAATGGPYWPNWTIANDVAVIAGSKGASGYVLDGFGGVHPFGNAPPVQVTGYWPNWDIAIKLVLIPGTDSGYVLDGFGGLHPFAAAGTPMPAVPQISGYWPNWTIANDVAVCPGGGGGYVLDGFGGIHGFGSQYGKNPTNFAYWSGWDIASSIVITGSDCMSGYMLDGYGGVHPWDSNGANGTSTSPAVQQTLYLPGQDVFVSLAAGRPLVG